MLHPLGFKVKLSELDIVRFDGARKFIIDDELNAGGALVDGHDDSFFLFDIFFNQTKRWRLKNAWLPLIHMLLSPISLAHLMAIWNTNICF